MKFSSQFLRGAIGAGLFLGAMGLVLLLLEPPSRPMVDTAATHAFKVNGRTATATAALPPALAQGYLGVIRPRMVAEVAPRFPGQIREIPVRFGDRVEKGTTVAILNIPTLQYELYEARGRLAAVKAAHKRLVVERKEAEEQLARLTALAAEKLAPDEELSSAKYKLQSSVAQIEATLAQIDEQRAQVDRLRQDRRDILIKAPFSGTVADRYVDVGANVTAATPVVRLITARDIFVRFAVPVRQAPSLAMGRKVTVRLVDRDLVLEGTVEKIAPEVDVASRMVFFEADLERPDPDLPILCGQIVRVSVK